MPALTVLIIRHAEKPVPLVDDPGLTQEGSPNGESLTVRGWQRAGAWAALFGAGLCSDYPAPNAIYAADPQDDSVGDDPPSRRPFETIAPLARRLGVKPITTFKQGDEADLVADVAKRAGIVLICWEHKRIVKSILPAWVDDGPRRWDPARFDIVLRLERPAVQEAWRLSQLCPRLLDGDSAQQL